MSLIAAGGLIARMSRGTPPAYVPGEVAWQNMSLTDCWIKAVGRTPNLHTHDSAALALDDYCPGLQWGDVVPEVDSSGLPTGVLYWRLGGDGDYTGNQVQLAFLGDISGSTIPVQTNLAVDSESAALWRNEIHISNTAGGTRKQGDVFAQKGGPYTVWQPAATHGYSTVSYVPGLGYIEDHRGAPGDEIEPEENAVPYSGQTDPLEWGTASYGMNTGQRAMIAWNRSGGSAGLWRNACDLSGTGFPDLPVAEWNPVSQTTVHVRGDNGSRSMIYEWDGSSTPPQAVSGYLDVTIGEDTVGLVGNQGAGYGVVWRISATHYLIYDDGPLAGPRKLTLWDRTSPNSITLLRGGAGNALIDAIPSGAQLHLAVDYANAQVYWLLTPSGASADGGGYWPFRLYRSQVSDLMNLVEVPVTGADDLDRYWIGGSNVSGNKCTFIYGGYLWHWGHSGSTVPGWGGAQQLAVRRLPLQ